MNNPARLLTPRILRFSAATVAAIFATVVVNAQQTGPPGPPAIKDPKANTLERQNREATLRSAELPAALDKVDPKRVAATIDQIKEDFRRIQIVRNELVRMILANKPFDYKVVCDDAGEVNKRADRLKAYLLIPRPNQKDAKVKERGEIAGEEMKAALVKLCNLIAAFVDNPVMKNPGTTDIQQAAKAGSDLLGIVELSGDVKRTAERLSKPSKQE